MSTNPIKLNIIFSNSGSCAPNSRNKISKNVTNRKVPVAIPCRTAGTVSLAVTSSKLFIASPIRIPIGLIMARNTITNTAF
ncbi:hypothetical protein DPMN_157539 [Dreissena polymorpha]|uniref:Uncharacterized protein n=1 Tax=Dreissena polymorpha TaxID=45954 RepID=A0A9D4EKP2_DREPO|nr:hypothetical protein DPMN_157539 [Dreissena polymorpha]